jgi:hypothetical protein
MIILYVKDKKVIMLYPFSCLSVTDISRIIVHFPDRSDIFVPAQLYLSGSFFIIAIKTSL